MEVKLSYGYGSPANELQAKGIIHSKTCLSNREVGENRTPGMSPNTTRISAVSNSFAATIPSISQPTLEIQSINPHGLCGFPVIVVNRCSQDKVGLWSRGCTISAVICVVIEEVAQYSGINESSAPPFFKTLHSANSSQMSNLCCFFNKSFMTRGENLNEDRSNNWRFSAVWKLPFCDLRMMNTPSTSYTFHYVSLDLALSSISRE